MIASDRFCLIEAERIYRRHFAYRSTCKTGEPGRDSGQGPKNCSQRTHRNDLPRAPALPDTVPPLTPFPILLML